MPHKQRAGEAAEINESHWGNKCPFATPDDEKCGFVTELPTCSHIAPDITTQERADIIKMVRFCTWLFVRLLTIGYCTLSS
jgi:DNA-directed RNA polymerase beta subunit